MHYFEYVVPDIPRNNGKVTDSVSNAIATNSEISRHDRKRSSWNIHNSLYCISWSIDSLATEVC